MNNKYRKSIKNIKTSLKELKIVTKDQIHNKVMQ